MAVGILTLHLEFPGSASLKDKRSRIKPLLARLHREFNISTAEIDRQDSWSEAVIACALVSNSRGHTERSLQAVVDWIEEFWSDANLVDDHIELI